MKALLRKEFRLVMTPTIPLFWLCSAMVLIPSYPYYVIFFYTTLGLFFACMLGRENHDVEYTLSLPIGKRDAVTARFLFALIVEGVQLILTAVFAWLRGILALPPNAAGMEANAAFFGLSLLLLGVYHAVFFTRYYRAPQKVGVAFAVSSTVVFLVILALEICAHVLPFFREVLDTPDPQHLPEKLIVLACGAVFFAVSTYLTYRRCCKTFEALDL